MAAILSVEETPQHPAYTVFVMNDGSSASCWFSKHLRWRLEDRKKLRDMCGQIFRTCERPSLAEILEGVKTVFPLVVYTL